MLLIDSHSHIDVAEFDGDRAAAIERARAAGVTRQIVPAIAVGGFPAVRDLCAANAGLYPAYGLHPLFLARHEPSHLDTVADWLARERPVAVGEIGLDFYVVDLDPQSQRAYFRRQLELARDFDLPVVLHARRAVEEVIATLKQVGGLRGVVHSYSGSIEQARQLWKLGFHLGFGGPITYPRARRLREIVATMPIEFLLLETDSPDQPLHGRQGRRNEPECVAAVCAEAAALRGVEPEELARATTANCERLFGLDRMP